MSFTMITPYHNHDTGYICLIIKDPLQIPEEITTEGRTLYRKSEFHISLMSLKNLIPIINGGAGVNITEDDLVEDFLSIQKEIPLSNFKPTKEFRYVKRGERETIVAMVEVPGIEDLFDQLRKKYNIDIPTQPTHITLYTLQPEAGIGILSEEELEQDSRLVDVPDLNIT